MPGSVITQINARYANPNADTVLVSEDKLSFRVDSHILRIFSNAFADTFGSPHIGSRSDQDGIALPIDSADLLVFLDLMHHHLLAEPIRDVQQFERLIDFAVKFEFEKLEKKIVQQIVRVAHVSPWEVFCVASRYDDQAIARTAIKYMGKLIAPVPRHDLPIRHYVFAYTCFLSTKGTDELEKCSTAYLLGLQECLLMRVLDLGSKDVLEWRDVAMDFSPMPRQV